jgi:hypothetical protein
MRQFIVAFLLCTLLTPSLFAFSCQDVFKKTSLFPFLGKDIQMNILDLAEALTLNPEHKGMGSEWAKYAVSRYGIDANIVRLTVDAIDSHPFDAQRVYAQAVKDAFDGGSGAFITLILSGGVPLAAKISSTNKDSAYFSGDLVPIVPPSIPHASRD